MAPRRGSARICRSAPATSTARPWGPINEVYDITRAGQELGWRPAYGFAAFLEALEAGRDSL